MDFQAALDCLKEGKRIQRSAQAVSYALEDGQLWSKGRAGGAEVLVPGLDIEDILAEDWVALV